MKSSQANLRGMGLFVLIFLLVLTLILLPATRSLHGFSLQTKPCYKVFKPLTIQVSGPPRTFFTLKTLSPEGKPIHPFGKFRTNSQGFHSFYISQGFSSPGQYTLILESKDQIINQTFWVKEECLPEIPEPEPNQTQESKPLETKPQEPASLEPLSDQTRENGIYQRLISKIKTKSFRLSESPEFRINFSLSKVSIFSLSRFHIDLDERLEGKVRPIFSGKFLKLVPIQTITPGYYQIRVSQGNQSQDIWFSWGLVSVNTEKPIYRPGEEAKIWMVVLDRHGYPVEGANVTLKVTDPRNASRIFSTFTGTIQEVGKGIYEARYRVRKEGNHTLWVLAEADDVVSEFESHFLSQKDYEFDILRQTPMVIDPKQGWFESTIQVISYVPFQNLTLVEYLPPDFQIKTDARVLKTENKTILKWENLSNGSRVSYRFSAPWVWPYLYEFGPSKIEYESDIFWEPRPWYLAVDPSFNYTEHLIDSGTNVYRVMDIEVLDFDKDGDLDFVACAYGSDEINWWSNQGDNQTFTNILIQDTPNTDGVKDIEVLDFDGDGDYDVVYAAGLENRIAWLENSGDNQTFTDHEINESATYCDNPSDIEVLDFDRDGDYDVVAALEDDDEISWFRNEGDDLTFTKVVILRFNANLDGVRDIEVLDFDGDGDYDIGYAATLEDRIAWLRNSGDNQTFTDIQVCESTLTCEDVRDIEVLDFDGDGDYDIVSAVYTDRRISWWENSGDNQSFTEHVIAAGIVYAEGVNDVEVGDMDGDGDYDVVVSLYLGDKLAWWRNSGNNLDFQEEIVIQSSSLANGAWTTRIIPEFENNGIKAIVLASYDGNRLAWWEPKQKPEITIFSPNETSQSKTVLLNFTVYDLYSTTLECWYSLNGELTYIGSVPNSSYYTTTIQAQDNKITQNLTVICQNSFTNGSSTVLWYAHPFSTGWLYRIPINITENSGENLTEYQVMLSLDTETLISEGKLQGDCNDTRFTYLNSSLGIEQEIPYFLDFNCNQNDTTFWVKIPWIPANGNTTLYFYYGNPNASSESNEPDVFSYSNLEEIYYVIDDTAAGKNLNITALEDNTLIKISNISIKLNSNGIDTYEYLSQGMKIQVTKPILGRPIGDVVDTISPISWAGKNFTVACTRQSDNWNFYSPFADTTVRIYSGSGLTPVATVTVPKGGYNNSAQDISGDNARIEADDPVLVFHSANSYDAFALYPASTDLYGVSSNYAYLTAFYDNTQVTVYWSDGSTSSLTQDRGSYTNLGNGATQGTGLAGHVVADKPVMVIQQADSDGVESTVWLPLKELDTKFVLPTDAQYIAAACPYSDTKIQIYYPNGSLQTEGNCGSNEYPYPNKFWYGNSTVGSGSAITMRSGTVIIASKPIYLYYEHKDPTVTDGDETNTLSYKQARKRAYYEPSSFEGEEEQSEFNLSNPTTYDSSYQETQKIPINHTVIIRINVTHSLGRDKISWIRLTLKHPNGTVMVNNESMTAAETIENGYIYDYNYTIPDSLESVGDWVVEIYGEDVYEKLEFRNTSFFAKETVPPEWSNFGANESNPAIEDWVKFFAYWTDNYNLSAWIFSWNATVTGYWENITNNFTGQGNWSNITLQIPTHTAGKTIAYRFYAKDFSGNWNSTELGTLEVQSESDTEPPVINVVYTTPKENGYGMNITIVANVTDNIGVDSVIANVTYPNGTYFNFSLEFDSSTLHNWSKPFQDTWQSGTYNFTIWANDTSGNANQTTITYNFSVQVNLWIDVISKKDIYGPNQDIQILDSTWWNRSWGYRMNITINNSAAQDLEEYQIMLEIPTQNIQDKIQPDCDDLRFTWYNQSSGKEEEIPYWLEKCNSSGTSIVWVKLPKVLAESIQNITMYYGNPDAESGSDLYGVFSFSSPQPIYYELSDNVGSSSLQVASYADSNQIVVGASSSVLDRQETYQFSVSQGSVINATKPISGKTLTASGTDSITPISFASTRFGYPYSRGTDEWNVHSPFGNANVTIYNYNSSGSLLGSQSFYVPKGSTQNLAYDVSLFGIVESNVSILVEYNPGSADSEVLYPASLELYGVASGNAYVGALEDNTLVKIYRSDGTYISTTLDRGEYTSTGGGGSQGTGDGIHIVADKPVVATSQADADGSESVAFWGPKDLNTEYVIPTDTQYFSIVCPEPGTTIYVYNPDGTLNESKSCGSNEPPYPNQVAFGNFDASDDYISYYAGTLVNGTKPFYLYYEYGTEDETSCTGPKQLRKLVLPEPTYSFGPEETPKALIRNSGSTNSFGYVIMYIESNLSGSWEWVSTQINDTQTQTKREINESLDLTQIWNTNPWNTDSVDSGYYRLVTLLTDSRGNILINQDSSQILNYTVFYVDIQAPVWNNLGVNDTNPKPGDWVKFYCNWSDNGVLDSWIFQWNISGNFENVSFGTFTSNPDWSNTTLQIPSSQEAHTIAYRFIANDTEGSYNTTDIYTLDVQDITPPTITSTQVSPNFIHRGESVNITATITDNVGVDTAWARIGIPENGYVNLTMEWMGDSLYNLTYQSQSIGVYNVTVYANDSYNNVGYGSTKTWNVYGWSEIHWVSPQDGEYPIRSVLSLVCQVTDSNTSEAIEGYPVTFWKDGVSLGTNLTNSSGYAVYSWDTTGESEGNHTLNCTIQDNSSLFYNVSLGNAYTEVTILVPSFQVIELKHENLEEHGINEYESNDTIDWVNVTINNTGGAEGLWVNVTLNVLDSSSSQVSWFQTQVRECGNLSVGETCEVQFSPQEIDSNAESGNYTWNITIYWEGGGSPPDWNRSIQFIIHNLPSNFSSSIDPGKINQNESSIYNITIYNPWSLNLTQVNITINCPSENMSCVCLGTTQEYCELGNISSFSTKTASFNISTNSSTQPADYPINATVRYYNPGLEQRIWEEQQTQILGVRGPTNLSVNITIYPETVTRGSLIDLKGYVNNTGSVTTEEIWLNWSLPEGWSNYSGNLSIFNKTLCPLCILWNNITANVSMDSKLGENEVTLISESSDQSPDWDTKTIYVYANTSLSNLQFTPPNPNRNETLRIWALLLLDNSSPISGEPVRFYINSTFIGENTTNSSGWVFLETRIPYNLSLGRTEIKAEYLGSDDIYTNPSSAFRYIVIKDTIILSNLTLQPTHTGYGMEVNISVNVTSFNSPDSVRANISSEYQSFVIDLFPENGLYQGSFTSTWDLGNYSVIILANNSGGYQVKSSPDNRVIGEAGTFTLTNTLENGYWETIQLNHCYENPIVIAGPLLHNNDESLVIRVSNITPCNFTLSMQWANQTVNSQSYTPSPESGYYLVVEEGIWELEDGSKIEARFLETNTTYDNHTWLLEPDSLRYELPFSQPIILATLQTTQDSKWVFAHVFDINFSTHTFNITLDQGETSQGIHGIERIGYVVLESDLTGSLNNKKYETRLTSKTIQGHDNGCYYFDFQQGYSQSPLIIGNLQTFEGSDGGFLRICLLNSTTVGFHVDEDRVYDSERSHVAESAGFIAFEDNLTLFAKPYEFNVTSNASVYIKTFQPIYGPNQDVLLTGITWFNFSWKHRKRITITNPNSQDLEEYQIELNLNLAPLYQEGKLQSQCQDLRFTWFNSSGPEEIEIPYYIEKCNLSSNSRIWIKVPKIFGNNSETIVYMYYDNPFAQDNSSLEDVFSYSKPRLVGYVVSSILADSTLDVMSLADGNNITIGGVSVTLDKQESASFSGLSQNTSILATKPFQADSSADVTDMISPISWAGKEFYYYSNRGTNQFSILSPFGTATVNIYDAGVLVWTGQVNQEGALIEKDIANGHVVRISSDLPVLVQHHADAENNDAFLYYPATSDYLYGTPSNYMEIGSGPDGASVSWVDSNGTTGGTTLSPNTGYSVSGLGDSGSPPPRRVKGSEPIGVNQLADHDGTEATTFLPYKELGTLFGSQKAAEYIAIAAPEPNTTCTVYNSSGGVVATQTGGNRTDINKLCFGCGSDTQFVGNNWLMVCDKPVHAYFEEDSKSDETNLFSWKQMRQYVYPEPWYEISEEEEISRIENFNSVNTSGYLLMKIQNNQSGIWTDTESVVNESFRRIIQESGYLNLADIWDSSWNTNSQETGYYRVIAYFRDPQGNILLNNDGSSITGYGIFYIDSTPPQWSNLGINNSKPKPGDWVKFFAYWSDNINLSHWTFSWNCTEFGSWVEVSGENFTSNPDWSNLSLQIPSFASGMYGYKFYAWDDFGNQNVTDTGVFWVPGDLQVNLILPPTIPGDGEANWTTGYLVGWNRTFRINASVLCEGGPCGYVNATLRYNGSSSEPDTLVPTSENKPFYIMEGSNPQECGELQDGDSCNVSWIVNATGDLHSLWKLDVMFTSDLSETNQTNSTSIYIGIILIVSLGFQEINFGIVNPDTEFYLYPAFNNSDDYYNITIHENSNDVEGLWIKGTDLTNGTPSYNTMVNVSHAKWSLTNLGDHPGPPQPANMYNLTYTYERINKDMQVIPSGTNETLYFWIDAPKGVYPRLYTGTVWIMANATD